MTFEYTLYVSRQIYGIFVIQNFTMAQSSFRPKKSLDYRQLHEGDALPKEILKKVDRKNAKILPETYTVERLICQKSSAEVIYLYLIIPNI